MLHEVKFDGYRTQVIKDAGGIRLFTKNGFDWTGRYRTLAEEAAAIEAETFILERVCRNQGRSGLPGRARLYAHRDQG
ncbi:hypothetical protein [Mesorhizobium sp. M0276]|uniref:hypothetical protein n=1 Tax=Mesorhizobium sp. M0276 TaxID=2956928 RepID=UPI00333B093B